MKKCRGDEEKIHSDSVGRDVWRWHKTHTHHKHRGFWRLPNASSPPLLWGVIYHNQYCVRLCHHGIFPCANTGLYTSLLISPLQEDKQWWTSSYTELHSAWYMNLGSREEKLKAKGRSPEQSNRGDKESSKKEFSKSKQTIEMMTRKWERWAWHENIRFSC